MFLEELFPFTAGKWEPFYAKSIGNNICFVSFCINLLIFYLSLNYALIFNKVQISTNY